jgi:hypothetical protein
VKPRGWAIVAVLLLGLLAGLLLASRGAQAGGSSLAKGGSGWLAARLYLEARGTETELLRRPLYEESWLEGGGRGPGVLVLVFPWQSGTFDGTPDAVGAHLGRGGDVLVGYSGEVVPTQAELAVLSTLDAEPDNLPRGPLSPWGWRERARRPLRLRAAPRWPQAPSGLELRRRRWLPEPPPGSELLLGAGGRPVVAAWRHGRGRVVMLPAEALSNLRLDSAAHGALLETLRAWLTGPWIFDEYHHGLVEGAAAVPSATRLGFDLLLAQLVLVYLVAALALARRLGPAWRERPPLVGSAASFLLRVGALHHRLGHHRSGAELLLRRAAELDRRFTPEPGLAALAARGDAAALVEVAQRVARRQRH